MGARPLGVPLTAQVLVTMLSHLEERPYVFTHVLTVDTLGTPVIAYGFAVPAESIVARTVKAVLESQPVLPTTLPALPAARIASSGLHRGCPGASARAFECVMSTGRFEISNASSVVLSPQCETSIAIPT